MEDEPWRSSSDGEYGPREGRGAPPGVSFISCWLLLLLSFSMSRSPGITFETAAPPLSESLPRMDVAAFVGFASRGPIDVPVPVEDRARFRDVFGPPLKLRRGTSEDGTITAHLGRAVEAFFRNGGRRCWVVRVAGPRTEGDDEEEPIRRARFGLPGVVSAETGRPVTVRARCFGASFDDLRTGTILHRYRLPIPSSLGWRGDGPTNSLRLSWKSTARDVLDNRPLLGGDLLRLSLDDHLYAYASVASRPRIKGGGAMETGGITMEAVTSSVHLFDRDPVGMVESDAITETDAGTEITVSVQIVDSEGAVGSAVERSLRRRTDEDDRPLYRLVVEGDGDDPVLLEDRIVRFEGPEGLEGWGHLGSIRREGGGRGQEIEVREHLWPTPLTPVGRARVLSPDRVERLRFDLLVWNDRDLLRRLSGLGFEESHPRAWTNLPTDDALFALKNGDAPTPESGSLTAEVFDPRFPLASPERPGPGPFLPLGMTDRPSPENTRGRMPPEIEHSRLERERLSTFSTDAFLDTEGRPPLAQQSTETLREAANQRFYLSEPPHERDVSGLHALWPIQEVTLLAVPDAVHRGWDEPRRETPTAASTPLLPPLTVDRDVDPPVIHLSWSVDRLEEEDIHVEVEEATEPTFDRSMIRYRGSESSIDRYVRSEEPITLYFRYRILNSGRPGAWSNTRRVAVPSPDFEDCRRRPAAIELDSTTETWLYWVPPEVSAAELQYEVETSRTPTFASVETAVVSPENLPDPPDLSEDALPSNPADHHWFEVQAGPSTPAVQYVRIRPHRSLGSQTVVAGWSNTIAIVRDLREETPVISTDEYDHPDADTPGRGREGLLDVHTAMLRFGAARGDVFCVLALPEHDQPEAARGHVARLRTPGSQLQYGEEWTLSFGGMYYPWLLGPEQGDEERLVSTPPDGATCGLIARRTLGDGVWTAPANDPLATVRTTVLPLRQEEKVALQSAPINAFIEEPRGVLTLGTATLAQDPDLEPIPTRRLLILVRRLAEREGPALVFENNGPRLRRRVAEQFDQVLRRLFRRGAFAGETPSEGYRVVADESINPAGEIEQGRLNVELHVAPARPLKFLTVRLVQRDGEPPVVAEGGPPVPT